MAGHRFEIEHAIIENFHMVGYYYGRSNFNLQIPPSWNNLGLSGTFSAFLNVWDFSTFPKL